MTILLQDSHGPFNFRRISHRCEPQKYQGTWRQIASIHARQILNFIQFVIAIRKVNIVLIFG
jgi:hypothetical protein